MSNTSIDDVLHLSTLYEAWEKVNDNQGMGGVDHVSLRDFEADLQRNLETLQNEVRYNTYRPLPLLRIYIDKADGDKRPLSIPAIRDRVLQTAVTLTINPVFEAEFEDISFAYRRGKSVAQAVSMVEHLRNKGYQWVVDADIRRYFDEVDHGLLMAEVSKLIHDKTLLNLIQLWLNATIIDKKQRYTLNKGIPQGSPLSPLLANLYLDHLDETLLDQNFRLVRYADDFVILCKSAEKAEQALELTEDVLEGLRLALNQQKTQITDFKQGFRFLGVRFIRSLAIKSNSSASPRVYSKANSAVTKPSNIPSKSPNQPPKKTAQETANWFSYALAAGEEYTSSDEMREAFAEAGISPTLFPSEPEPREDLSPPFALEEEAEPEVASPQHDPRLKTLYLMEHGSVLGKEYERFIVKREGKILKEIPAIHVDQIMVFGNSQLTTQVMQFCLQQRIPIYLLSGKGHYYGMVDSFDTDPVLLHREQFLKADDQTFCLKLAVQLIKGKIANSRLMLKRLSRNRDIPAFEQASEPLKNMANKLDTATSLDQLRGYEGNAARIYFQAIAAALDSQWQFNGRNKQPPTDPVNALLSYGYTLLFYNLYSFLRARGLNPHVGYLHPMRMGHPALASDMMEEFRSIVVDAVVLQLVFNAKITPEDFTLPTEAGEACLLKPDARKLFIKHLEIKLNTALKHPVSGLNLDYRRCMEHQINHLAAVIRDKETAYQPLVLR